MLQLNGCKQCKYHTVCSKFLKPEEVVVQEESQANKDQYISSPDLVHWESQLKRVLIQRTEGQEPNQENCTRELIKLGNKEGFKWIRSVNTHWNIKTNQRRRNAAELHWLFGITNIGSILRSAEDHQQRRWCEQTETDEVEETKLTNDKISGERYPK